ncbi:MAG: type II toxin-antitoxin system RelB/DinJ family antitoxin [Bacteroidales bacterium]|nr:type II toxin-antitoxin system RelB/DinJ family antitoxin [Bacteroidales bacterium]
MPQSAMTVRLDSQMKSRFDELCNKFGMSANTAINIFVNAVVRTQSIPFSISTTEETPGARALKAFQNIRQSVNRNEPEMTLEEINEEIRQARAERKARLENDSVV